MASMDDSRSYQMASDEIYDRICGPCKIRGVEKEACHYCQNCEELLCEACKDYHKALAITKTHKILSGNKFPSSATKSTGDHVICGCNRNQKLKDYCEDHREVVCTSCRKSLHHACKSVTIRKKSSGYLSSTFDSLLSKTKSLKDRYERLLQENIEFKQELKQLKVTCKIEIKTFRKELDTFFDKLENAMLAELDKYERKEQLSIEEHISKLTSAFKQLDIDHKLLVDAKQDRRKKIMFASDVRVSKRLPGYESNLHHLEKDAVKPNSSFERNKQLTDILRNINSLGVLKTENPTDNENDAPVC